MIAAGIASVVALLGPGATAQAEEACAQVVAPPSLPDPWAEALADLKEEIARLPASDCQPMTLSLEPQQDGMRIIAITSDGRRAERSVPRPESLVAKAFGLLMTIPQASPRSPASPQPPPAPESSEARAVSPLAGPPPLPSTIALWAGLSSGIRVAAPVSLSVIDVEARADVIFNRWLMLVSLQSSLVSCLGKQGLDCDVYTDVSLGAGVGRRFRVGAPDIDVALAPAVVVMHMEYDGAAGAEGQALEGTAVALRFDASTRLAIPVSSHWALTVTLEGGLAPSMLTNPSRLALPAGAPADAQQPPAFPAWSGGVRVGASGALL